MNRLAGIILVALSAAGFGTLGLFGRFAYADQMDALSILFLRFSLAAGVMATVLMVRREPLPRGKTLLVLVGMGALGYVGQSFAYLTALNYASSGLVALLLYVYPVIVMLLSLLLLHEQFTLIKGVSLGIAITGTALTVDPAGGQVLGVLLALTGAAIYSIYIVVGAQVLKRVSVIQSSVVIFASAGAASGILMLLNGPHLPTTSSGWGAVGAIVMIATVLPVAAFLGGLERVGPSNAAMLSTLEPVVTVILGAVWLRETIRPMSLIGGGLILIAVLLLTRSELRRSPTKPQFAPGFIQEEQANLVDDADQGWVR
ncbi:MAG: EamA family transporter [Anaerolinea sp.]|nr:EamA family transporter [Anaerolinea sp.]MCC6974226.1 EamA family transporter [Anaerolineae bacterium]